VHTRCIWRKRSIDLVWRAGNSAKVDSCNRIVISIGLLSRASFASTTGRTRNSMTTKLRRAKGVNPSRWFTHPNGFARWIAQQKESTEKIGGRINCREAKNLRKDSKKTRTNERYEGLWIPRDYRLSIVWEFYRAKINKKLCRVSFSRKSKLIDFAK